MNFNNKHVFSRIWNFRLDSSFNTILFERVSGNRGQITSSNSSAPIHAAEITADSNNSVRNYGSLNASGDRNTVELKTENAGDGPIEIVDSDDEAAEQRSEAQADNDTNEEQPDVCAKQEIKAETLNEMMALALVEFHPNEENESSRVESDFIVAESATGQSRPRSTSNEQKKLKHNGDGLFECTDCRYSSRYQNNFKRHQQIHDKNAVKPFKCQQCSYTVRFKWNLKTHLRNHHDARKLDGTGCFHRRPIQMSP